MSAARPGATDSAAGTGEAGLRALERFRAVAADPRAEAAAIRERTDLPIVGYVDPYLPEELIMAHGLVPFRITLDGREELQAVEFIQSYACPAARNLLDQALSGRLDFLGATLFTRYCDSLRGVFAVWDAERLTPVVDFVRYPTVVDTDAAVGYLAAELREVSDRLGAAFGTQVDDRRVWEAVDKCDRKRKLVAELAGRRARRDLALAGADYLAVLVSATTMLPDEFTSELRTLLDAPPVGEPGDALPVVLSGTTFDNVSLAAHFEETGLYIIADDLSTGSRWWSVAVREGDEGPRAIGDPWTALARAYLGRPPDSVKEPSTARTDHLIGQVRASGAEGVVFYLTKFCDSEQAEWPYVRGRLDEQAIPSLLIEGDHHAGGFAQVRTRLEAFREQLEVAL